MSNALSRERIVDAAVALLDELGEGGLTFRALAARLETGAGAIYWHIENKGELLVAATDAVVVRALADVATQGGPRKTIRAVAAALFEAIDAHPWAGAQLSQGPWPKATMDVFERIGRQLQALKVPAARQFTAASTLVSYILGVSSQNAANGRVLGPAGDRDSFLEGVAARWTELDAKEYAFTRSLAAHLRAHDDRAEFLAGIDLIVAGITAGL